MSKKDDINISVEKINKLIDYKFENTSLLIESFTHKSISENNYERLEFLGDAVLQLIITKNLYATYPDIDEGTLSREKQSIVSKKIISKISLDLKLIDFLIAKNLDLNSSLSLKNTIAANMIESLIGAIFLDSNYSVCEEIVLNIFSKYLVVKKNIGIKDSKTLLQEYMQSLNKSLPVYATMYMEGPPHQPGFKITCKIPIYKEIFESKSVTVREGQQAVSKIILDKINNEKKI
jgi:ribonuclease III